MVPVQRKQTMLRVKLAAFKTQKSHAVYRMYYADAMADAYISVKDDSMPIRKAARVFSVPETSLRRRVNGSVDVDCVRSGPDPLFSMEQEARLVNHVKLLARVGYGYSRGELCNLATEFAVDLGLRDREHPLSLQWYRNFRSRWPDLTAKVPRTLSIARAKATNETAVGNYFEELNKILTKYHLKDKPQYIYNVDEKGVTADHTPPKIVTAKGDTPVAVTTGMSYKVTILGAGNAIGSSIPPYFVFPGKKMRSELMEGATPGANGTVSDSGWSNGDVFRKYLQEHFLTFAQGRDPTQPILLLYDGHRSHISMDLIDWAKTNNIILFVLPPHTSHVLQPLDVGCFGPFQKIYDNLRHKFIRYNLSSTVPKHAVCELSCKAYSLSLSPANLVASFLKCGIHPYNPAAVNTITFMPSTVFKASHEKNQELPNEETSDDTPATDKVAECTIDEKGDSNPRTGMDEDEQAQQATRFFRNKEGVLMKESNTKKRKVLSAVVGGKAITEDSIVQKIKEHIEEQSSKKKPKSEKTEINQKHVKTGKVKSEGKQTCTDSKMKNRQPKARQCPMSQLPGPSGLQPMLLDTSDDDVTDDDDDVSEQDLCCVCKKFSPAALREIDYIDFLKWGQCTIDSCGHWVHLKFCTLVRCLRRHDTFKCPCH